MVARVAGARAGRSGGFLGAQAAFLAGGLVCLRAGLGTTFVLGPPFGQQHLRFAIRQVQQLPFVCFRKIDAVDCA
jgi:hypothetical protein